MSNDLKDLIDTSKSILNKLKMDKDTPRISHQDQLREEIATYIGNQTRRMIQDDQFTEIAELELADRIMQHNITNEELMEYIRIKKNGKAINTTALLEIFKPSPNSSNPLITPPPSLEGDNDILKDLDPNQRQALAKLQMFLGQAVKNSIKKNTKEGSEDDNND